MVPASKPEGPPNTPHKSACASTTTKKQKAIGELQFYVKVYRCYPLLKFCHSTDEGSDERMKKKIKTLEDKLAELADTNNALSRTIRAMRKEKAATRHDTNNNRGNGNNDEDNSVDNNSPMLFKSQNVCIPHFLLPRCLHLAEDLSCIDQGCFSVGPRCCAT